MPDVPDVPGILHRHGEWQRSLVSLSWAEKVRMAEAVRASVEAMARLRAAERGGDLVGCPYRAAAIRARALLETPRR